MKNLIHKLGLWLISKKMLPMTANALLDYSAPTINSEILTRTVKIFDQWQDSPKFEPVPANLDFLADRFEEIDNIIAARERLMRRYPEYKRYRLESIELNHLDALHEEMRMFLGERMSKAFKANKRRKRRAVK